ncbi:hypothetical protein EYC80_004985 [Monilinia laxa]|uniref:Uncharacterized protein n=1 Tax=Monilinia laxa TaxID=61186 RepID=A0A5N6KII6_MONLA|nr:hypothetical protein EYC80_004985 [Monilinia laxa]
MHCLIFSDMELRGGKMRYTGIAGVTDLKASLLLYCLGGSKLSFSFYAFYRSLWILEDTIIMRNASSLYMNPLIINF